MSTTLKLADRPLLAELERAFQEGRAPDFASADVAGWVKVADMLVQQGRLEAAEHAIRRLNVEFPDIEWARTLCDLFEMMPPTTDGQVPFADDFPKDVQIVPREGADIALLVFCGVKHRLGMPLPMSHRWLGRARASIVYLRDLKTDFYLGGVTSLGDRAASIEALRQIVKDLGARRIVTFGNSSGGYGALDYGMALGAEAAMSMSGQVNLTPEFNVHLGPALTSRRLNDTYPGATLDLRDAILASTRPPRTWVVYGEDHWDDRLHAEHLAGLPQVTLRAVERYKGHNTTLELIRRGQFDDLVRELTA